MGYVKRFFIAGVLPILIPFLILKVIYTKMESEQHEKYWFDMEEASKRYPYHKKDGYSPLDDDEGMILVFKRQYSEDGYPTGLMYYDEDTGFAALFVSREVPGNERFDDERWHRAHYKFDGEVVLPVVVTHHEAHLYQTMSDGRRYRVFHIVLAPGNCIYGTCPNRSQSIIGRLFDNGGDVYGDRGILRDCFYR